MNPVIRQNDDLLFAIHGKGPWMLIRDNGHQKAAFEKSTSGFQYAFVHRPRGLWDRPAFTSITVEIRQSVKNLIIPFEPSVTMEIGAAGLRPRLAFMWVFTEPLWPQETFHYVQSRWNSAFCSPADRAGMSRLIPLPQDASEDIKITLSGERYDFARLAAL